MNKIMSRFLLIVVSLILGSALILPHRAAAQASPTQAESTRISGAYDQEGDVRGFTISPNRQYVVYPVVIYFENHNYVMDLYSVDLSTGQRTRLTPLLGTLVDGKFSPYLPFVITLDNNYVIYSAWHASETYQSIYRVPIQGGDTVRLGKAGVSCYRPSISPNGQWVTFFCREGESGIEHLYRVDVNGSADSAVDITPPNVRTICTDYCTWSISPDNQHFAFTGWSGTSPGLELFMMPLTGKGNQATLLAKQSSFTFTPDGKKLIYLPYSVEYGEVDRIYAITTDGAGSPVDLSGEMAHIGEYWISPDGKWLVFAGVKGNSPYELYSVSLEGQPGTPVKLTIPLPSGNAGVVSSNIAISPDSMRVVYNVDSQLFSVPISGPASANVELSSTAYRLNKPLFTPDSSRVIFNALEDETNEVGLYSVPAAGPASAAVKLNVPLTKNAQGVARVDNFAVIPDEMMVFYVAPTTTSAADTLFVVPAVGPASASKQLDMVKNAGDVIRNFTAIPGQRTALYLMGSAAYNTRELFLAEYESMYGTKVYLPSVMKK